MACFYSTRGLPLNNCKHTHTQSSNRQREGYLTVLPSSCLKPYGLGGRGGGGRGVWGGRWRLKGLPSTHFPSLFSQISGWHFKKSRASLLTLYMHKGLYCVSTDHDHQGLRWDLIFWPDLSLVGDLYTKMHSNAHRLWQIAAVGSRRSGRRWIAGHHRSPAATPGDLWWPWD